MSTTHVTLPTPPATPASAAAAPAPAPTPSPTPDAATAVAQVKTDLHQAAEDVKSAYWSISATARADFQKLLADVEAAHGASFSALKKILGI